MERRKLRTDFISLSLYQINRFQAYQFSNQTTEKDIKFYLEHNDKLLILICIEMFHMANQLNML